MWAACHRLIGLGILIYGTKRGFCVPETTWDFGPHEKWDASWTGSIAASGKTLEDAGLTAEGGTFSVPGQVQWVDADGNAITPCFTYADSRCSAEVDQLRQTLDEDATQQRTGTRCAAFFADFNKSALFLVTACFLFLFKVCCFLFF